MYLLYHRISHSYPSPVLLQSYQPPVSRPSSGAHVRPLSRSGATATAGAADIWSGSVDEQANRRAFEEARREWLALSAQDGNSKVTIVRADGSTLRQGDGPAAVSTSTGTETETETAPQRISANSQAMESDGQSVPVANSIPDWLCGTVDEEANRREFQAAREEWLRSIGELPPLENKTEDSVAEEQKQSSAMPSSSSFNIQDLLLGDSKADTHAHTSSGDQCSDGGAAATPLSSTGNVSCFRCYSLVSEYAAFIEPDQQLQWRADQYDAAMRGNSKYRPNLRAQRQPVLRLYCSEQCFSKHHNQEEQLACAGTHSDGLPCTERFSRQNGTYNHQDTAWFCSQECASRGSIFIEPTNDIQQEACISGGPTATISTATAPSDINKVTIEHPVDDDQYEDQFEEHQVYVDRSIALATPAPIIQLPSDDDETDASFLC
jgi:hypothetical protein